MLTGMPNNYEGLSDMPTWYLAKWYPNMDNSNYQLTSNPTTKYNCVAWADKIDYTSIDLSLDEEGEPLIYPDLSCLTYIEYFEKKGYQLCETFELEDGFEKIALYETDQLTFEHVARQLPNGNWTSKLGEWDDIEHNSLTVLESEKNYGFAKWFMKRELIDD